MAPLICEQHADQLSDVAAGVVDVRLQQDRVARGLVELDVVFVGHKLLELGAVVAGGAADQGHAGRVEAELVLVHAADLVLEGDTRREEVDEAALAVLGWHHLVGAEHLEVLGDQRMGVDLAADVEGDLDGVGDKAVAFELHLPAGDVEAGDELLVGRGRGVGEDRLVELRLDVAEVDVLDQQHRTLAQRRHRLVGRVGLVDAQADLARVGDQPGGEEGFLGGVVAELGLLFSQASTRGGVGDPLLDRFGRAHRGAGAEERRPAGEAEPGLVPEEDEVRLDGEAFLHHPARVVDVAVEGAVGQVDHLRPVEPALGLEGEERLLDAGEGHRAIHRVFGHREGVDVERLAAGEHQAVVVRLVAVAVEEHDVAGGDQRLVHHLVRGAGAVGNEEDVVGAEGARGHVLGVLDVAGRLQQAVEAAGRGARFGEEDVQAVELAHVADPVGLEHRLAARDRQRVEGADRPHRVLLQVVEERACGSGRRRLPAPRGAAPAAPRPSRGHGGCRTRGDRRRCARRVRSDRR